MDFIIQLPMIKQEHNAIFIIIDQLTKQAHFYPITTSISAPEVARIFFNNIFKLHELPHIIISDHNAKFTSKFWKALFAQVRTKLSILTAFHP